MNLMAGQFGNTHYTIRNDSSVDSYVASIIQVITNRIVSELHPTSVVLSGSFGRGEGTVLVKDGKIHVISDFEVGCVDRNWFKRWKLRKLELILSEQLEVDLTLNFYMPRRFTKGLTTNLGRQSATLTIDQYELMAASRFIYGPDLRAKSLFISPEQIPLWEGIRLMLNRMVETIAALLRWDDDEYEVGIQKALYKLLIACGDSLLLLHKRYNYSYKERMTKIQEMLGLPTLSNVGISLAEHKRISESYNHKLTGNLPDIMESLHVINSSVETVDKVFRLLISEEMGFCFSNYEGFKQSYLRSPKLIHYCKGFSCNPLLQNGIAVVRDKSILHRFNSLRSFWRFSVLHGIYSTVRCCT